MSKPQKILFIGSFPKESYGGTSTATLLLIESKAFSEYTILKVDSTLKNIRYNYWIGRIFRAIKRFVLVHKYLLFDRPDTALIFCGHGPGFIEKGLYVLYLRYFKVPSVLAPRSGIILQNLRNKSFKAFAKRVFRRSTFIICQGAYWKRIFGNYVDKHKLKVIYNWIPLPDKKIDCAEIKSDEPVRLLFVGWLEAYKGLRPILNVVRELRQQKAPLELHIYGEGSLRPDIQNYIRINHLENTVFLHNWVTGKDKEEAFLNSTVLVQASTFEGMPNVILEAMSYGLPVIANGVSTIPEVVRHKKNGLLFYRQDEKDLLIQVRSLIENRNLCKILSNNARKQIEENHQVERAAPQIIDLLKEAQHAQ